MIIKDSVCPGRMHSLGDNGEENFTIFSETVHSSGASFTPSHHVFLGRLLGLVPSTSIVVENNRLST